MSELHLSNTALMQGLTNFYLTTVDGFQFTLIENPVIAPNNTMTPTIEISEQPASRFRFRYKSETGSHGSLMGENSSRKNKTYPSIKMRDCMGKVKIVAKLYYIDEKTGEPIWHVHKLEGKNCNPDGIYEKEYIVNSNEQIIHFNGIHIKHVAKRNVLSTLNTRYLKEFESEEYFGKFKKNLRNLSDSKMKVDEIETKALSKAEEMSKILERNLNDVKIGFQAYLYLETGRTYVEMCAPVFTHKILNRKSAATGDLNISRMSSCSGSVHGGDEIFILCEKVDKKNIEVKFYLDDDNGDEIWSANGLFTESDVHHQYAIVFKTPQYKNLDIEDEVDVQVQLYRPKDRCESEPIVFTYKPTEYGHQRKKAKMLSSAASSRNMSDINSANRRQPLMGRRNGNLSLKLGTNGDVSNASSTQTSTSTYGPNTAEVIEDAIQLLGSSTQSQTLSNVDEIEQELMEYVEEFTYSLPIVPDGNGDILKLAVKEAEIDSPANESGAEMCDEADVNIEENEPMLISSRDPYLSDTIENDGLDHLLDSTGFLDNYQQYTNVPRGGGEEGDDDDDNDLRSDGFTSDSKKINLETRINTLGKLDQRMVYRLAERIANSLLDYARYDDIRHLLKPMVELLAFSDESGDNAIHLAVIHSKVNVLKVLLETMAWSNPNNRKLILNAFNDASQTPLHIAICNNEMESIKLLLSNCVDTNIRDKLGNNSYHIAVLLNNSEILKELLKHSSINLDLVNNAGYTPLHLAVMYNSKSCIKELLDAGADIDHQDRTSGRTALHIAVQNKNIPMVEYLLEEKADADCKMFNGRSALHMAVLLESEEMVSLLIAAYADPYLESDELQGSIDSSDDDINVEEATSRNSENNAVNCFDMAKDNKRILAILHGNILPDLDDTEKKYEEFTPTRVYDDIIPNKSCPMLNTGPDSGYKSEPIIDSGLCLHDERYDDKCMLKQPNEDSGVNLYSDDDLENKYSVKRRPGVDSGLGLCSNEKEIVDYDTKISLSKLLDPPSEKDWRGLITCVGKDDLIDKLRLSASPTVSLLAELTSIEELEYGLEALGSKEGLHIVNKYKGLTEMMGKLNIK